jgi:hypothetical protein
MTDDTFRITHDGINNETVDVTSYLAMVMGVVEEHGWAIQTVSPAPERDDGAHFAYTVGITNLGHPELIIVGLPALVCQQILNRMVLMIKNGRAKFGVGDLVSGLIPGTDYQLKIGPVDPELSENNLIVAHALYEDVQALQVIWPDINGRYPDDENVVDGVEALQPLLHGTE